MVGGNSSRGDAAGGLICDNAEFPDVATAILGETRWEKCRFKVRSRILRLIGLSSTMRVRNPPERQEEKESRDLWREGNCFGGQSMEIPGGSGLRV